ncbi:hypothetical protein K8I28_06285 [bacterium]|nr:hypothetical protein [bacterium]
MKSIINSITILIMITVVIVITPSTSFSDEVVQIFVYDIDDGANADLQDDYDGHFGWAQDSGDGMTWEPGAFGAYLDHDIKTEHITIDGGTGTWWSHVWETAGWRHAPATTEYREYSWPTVFGEHYMEHD